MAIALITTGGTIVSTIDAATGLALPDLGGRGILAALAQRGFASGDVEVHDVVKVASPQLEPDDWLKIHASARTLLARDDIDGLVVTHGTSTLEETAWFLDLTLRTDKPVVVTGAQRNASEPDSDGPRNLHHALLICRSPQARGLGVLVSLNGHVNAAREVTKSHTLDVETFQSGQWGYLGTIIADRVLFRRTPTSRLHLPLVAASLPAVDIVAMYPGASGALVQAAVDSGARGLVIEALASGHVNAPMGRAIAAVLKAGIPVVVASRIPRGGTRIGYGFEGSSHHLVDAGAILSGDLSPWKARVLLMLALQAGQADRTGLARLFDMPLRICDPGH